MIPCPRCGARLSLFPGAELACACGEIVSAPAERAPPAPAAGPYRRSSSAPGPVDRSVRCPFCGGAFSPLDRACPSCDVPLDRVRCPACLRLEVTGRPRCGGCGGPLRLPAGSDAMGGPCPRCEEPLSAIATQEGMFECARCHGLFVETRRAAELLGAERVASDEPPRLSDEVRYLPCPACHEPMHRYAAAPGVVVDSCMMHGTWFDALELEALLGGGAARR